MINPNYVSVQKVEVEAIDEV